MRVLMVSNGRSVHARRPLKWILSAGHEVLFLDTHEPLPQGLPDGCRRLAYPRYHRSHYLSRCLGSRAELAAAEVIHHAELWWIYRHFGGQIVHVHYVDAPAYHCAKAGLHPLLLSAWGTDINRFSNPAHDPETRRMVSYALQECDCLITDAPAMVRRCEELAGRTLRHRVLPLGIKTALFSRDLSAQRSQWRKVLQIPEDAFVFGSFRELRPHYNHRLILEAFAQATARISREIFLLFKVYHSQGSDSEPDYERSLHARALELGIAAQVAWVRGVSDQQLPELYAAVDALINFPQMDGFPVHFLEAAAAGKPVISCRLPAYEWGPMQDYVAFAAAADEADLARAMRETVPPTGSVSKPEAWQAARQAAIQAFDEQTAARALAGLYAQCSTRSG